MAQALARHKAKLAIIDRDASMLQETLRQCGSLGGIINHIRLTLATSGQSRKHSAVFALSLAQSMY
jgi:hypothetical protein